MGTLIPILLLILAYLIGSIPFGVVIGKIRGIDIRNHGSHNIGATNALRTLGTKWGIVVFLLDFIKGGLFVFLTKYVIDYQSDFFTITIHPLVYGTASTLGHLFPIYLKFKGGKGVSSVAGAMTAYFWPFTVIAIIGFIIVVAITRYVSLGSTAAGILLFICYLIFARCDFYLLAFLLICVTIALIKHIPNYKRIIKGEENKLSFKKKK